jgi:hypothetical protein
MQITQLFTASDHCRDVITQSLINSGDDYVHVQPLHEAVISVDLMPKELNNAS